MTEEKKAEEAKLDQEKVINSLDDLGNMYNFRNDLITPTAPMLA